MNQTNWIIGGGIVIVAAAMWLYMMSGDGLPKALPIKNAAAVALTDSADNSNLTDNNRISESNIPVIQAVPINPNTKIMTETQLPADKKITAASEAPSDTVVLRTSIGNISVRLYADAAPNAVENFIKLSKSGFYDGVKFHRVIKGFMIQGGDPLSKDDAMVAKWGTGGPGYQFADEINKSSAIYEKGYKHGVLAMANSGPNTNGSQFFIMAADYPLPPLYVIFGEVTNGLDVVDAIDAVQTDRNDRPLTPVVVTKAEVK